MPQRQRDLTRFYAILDDLAVTIGGARLAGCDGRMAWPERGVYFFRECGENRTDSGAGARIVRVGTHAIKDRARSTLWGRLYQHRGTRTGGNHRGSIFRALVGVAIIKRERISCPTWKSGNSAPADTRAKERPLEKLVSGVIGGMSVLWLAVTDAPSPQSRRGSIERNAIALLSNYRKPPLDAPSRRWLGWDCDREKVRGSGLWNQNHVDEEYDPEFLNEMEMLAMQMRAS
ncbi:MAG: hypothetical protein OD918_05765 [Gammaproteobacteria bacterium]